MAKPFNDQVLDSKYKELEKAIKTLSKSMALDLNKYSDETELDTIKNGQIQKFEYSLELTWKFIKSYLSKIKGINAQGLKHVIREFAKFNYFEVEEIELFIEMIDDRNRVAHEYKEYIVSVIYPKLENYKNVINKFLSLRF